MKLINRRPVVASLLACCASASITSNTSLTVLFQNDLDVLTDYLHTGAILLDPMTRTAGAAACAAVNETLLPASSITGSMTDFSYPLQYFASINQTTSQFIIANGTVTVPSPGSGTTLTVQTNTFNNYTLPVLCTQSDRGDGAYGSSPSTTNQISVVSKSTGNVYQGYRNLKSFRFLGIPYANPFNRFEYSTVYNKTGQTINATNYGADCIQAGDSADSENCLFMNIQTPYIPKLGSVQNLKPVLFTIHGGGYTGGNGGAGFDAGNLASREDIVGVSINYRLSTLGFLAIPGTTIKGNFGIGDQITALRWVRQNIASFGGDPNRITIIGESAGAGSVKALLGSPIVIAENLIVGAVMQSNLGGGVDLGLSGTYATTFSSYYTVNQSYAIAGQNIFREAGCTQTALSDQITCIKTVSAQTLVNLADTARYVVQDGTIINTEQLVVSVKNGSVANVPVIIGTTENDGASFFTWPKGTFSSEAAYISAAIGVSSTVANSIVNSGLFPLYSSGNTSLDYFNVTQRVVTDANFRCIDEAIAYTGAHTGVFQSAYYYTFERTYGGFDPNNLGATGLSMGPVTSAYPNGDPYLPYFKLHGSEAGFTYGNIYPIRDQNDIVAAQLISGYFASFAKTGNPNPSSAYLSLRGYNSTISAVGASGAWQAVNSTTGPAKNLDYISPTVNFPDQSQCSFLNYPITYYINGGA